MFASENSSELEISTFLLPCTPPPLSPFTDQALEEQQAMFTSENSSELETSTFLLTTHNRPFPCFLIV